MASLGVRLILTLFLSFKFVDVYVLVNVSVSVVKDLDTLSALGFVLLHQQLGIFAGVMGRRAQLLRAQIQLR